MTLALHALNVNKTYQSQKVQALSNLNLRIKEGQIFGLLGPNGAGKSTLMKASIGLLKIDSGILEILGANSDQSLHRVGYVPEEINVYQFLSGEDFLYLVGGLRGVSKRAIKKIIKEYNDIFMLPDLKKLILSYSKGNKEKILLLSSMLHNPDLLILDEPLTGLDPEVSRNVKNVIRHLSDQGKTVILSTHILDVVAELCDEIAIIVSGQIREQMVIKRDQKEKINSRELENIYMESIRKGDRG